LTLHPEGIRKEFTMRVILINTPTPEYMPNKEFILPPSLLCLAAVLNRADFEVEILDLNIYKSWEIFPENTETFLNKIITEKISSFKPSLVGIGCLFSGQFPSVLKFSETIKNHFPTVPIVIGGMHPTIYPSEILRNCSFIDYVVIGEGEEQIVALANGIRNGTFSFEQIEGLACRKNGIVIVNPKKTFIEEMSNLPFPAYDLINFEDYYHDTSHWHNPKGLSFNMTVPIISSRSCPMRCNFCSMFLVMGPKIRTRTPENVVDEIQLLYEKYGQRHFSFMDDNVNIRRKHIIKICKLIMQRNLDIEFETPNGLMTAGLDQEIMDVMIQAGWVRGAIAIESGSDFIRNKVMGKHLSREKIYEVTQLAKSYKNLYFKAYFIIGMPEDTRETLEETYDMIKEIDIDETYVTNLLPFPGTAVFEQAVRDNLFIEELDIDNLWRMQGFHYTDNKRFYIKPYQLELGELREFRDKFDALLAGFKTKRQLELNHACA
jgi:radical SAM superfamily enzyme YgiQ (UPF0313 family)